MKEERFNPDAATSILNSCIGLCDVIIEGKDNAVGLKYDEENMFAPMIVFLEKDTPAEALISAAENLGVPVMKNIALAKNLSTYGKSGSSIPERSYRDVSLALSRSGTAKFGRHPRAAAGKNRQGVPLRVPRPLSLELGAALFALTGEEPGREKLLEEPLNAIRKKLIRLLGITIPPFRVAHNAKLKNDEYRILFKGLEAGRGRLELIMPPMPEFPEYESESIRTAARTAAAMFVRHADEIVQRRAPELLGRDEVDAILDAAEEKYPVVTGEVKSLLSLGLIREILQSLVSEQVSIRHIAVILETLADWGSFGPAPSDLVIEQIRQSLKRQICLEYADDKLTLRVLTLEPKLERRFTDRLSDRSPDNSEGEELTDLISTAVKRMDEKGFPPVILCSPKARAPVKEATRRKLPNLAVLSYVEIPSDISVEPLGEIRLEGKR
jgi:flagellar biosynthesis protein FlhA